MVGRLSIVERVAYAAGSLGTGGFATVPGLLLLIYLTDTLGVPAWAAGAIALAPKVIDLAVNPVLGSLSDRSMHRHGTRRRWLLLGAVTLPPAFVVMFAVPSAVTGAAAAGWVTVTFVACVVAFASFQVTYLVLPAEITDDYQERTDLMSWRIAFLALAILLFGAGAPALVTAGGGGRRGYLVMAAVVGTVLAVAMLGSWRGLRSVRAWSPPAAEASLRERAAAIRESRPFAVLLGAFVLQALATGTMLAALAYVAVYLLGGAGRTSLLFVGFIGPALLVMPAWRWVGTHHGKRAGFLAASVLFVVATLALSLVRTLPDAAVYALVGLVGVAYAGMQLFPLAMLPDALAADAAVSGSRRAGVFTGVWTAAETTGLALGPGVVALSLAAAGFVSGTSGSPGSQPPAALTAVAVVFSLVPAALTAASLPLVRRYDLSAQRLHDLLETEEPRWVQ
jgi:Na+/melibiose symporter-like transporter